MTAESRIKALAGGVTITLFASLIGTGILYRDNSLLSEDVKAEKVRTERLEAERGSLKQEMDKLRADLAVYTVKNGELDLAFRDAQRQLAEGEARVASLKKENASIAQLKKENAAIRKIRQDLVAQLENIKKSNSNLQAEVAELNRTIAGLRKENETLITKTSTKSSMAYNFRTEVVKRKKDRLTVKAKRTHHIHLSFDVNNPGEVNGDFYIKVKSPKNQEVSGELVIAEDTVMQPELLSASIEQGWAAMADFRRISLKFDPEQKLEAGIYNVMVYSGNNYLGSTQFRLE